MNFILSPVDISTLQAVYVQTSASRPKPGRNLLIQDNPWPGCRWRYWTILVGDLTIVRPMFFQCPSRTRTCERRTFRPQHPVSCPRRRSWRPKRPRFRHCLSHALPQMRAENINSFLGEVDSGNTELLMHWLYLPNPCLGQCICRQELQTQLRVPDSSASSLFGLAISRHLARADQLPNLDSE